MPQGTKIADAALKIPCTNENFLRVWFDLLKPVHKLTQREIDVAIAFVKRWYELRDTVRDDKQLNRLLLSAQEKKEIMASLGLSKSHMHLIMTKLKQRRIVVDGKLNYRYIPNYQPGIPFRLMFILENAETTRTDNKEDV